MAMFIDHQHAILAEIAGLLNALARASLSDRLLRSLELLKNTNRRLLKELQYAKGRLTHESVSDLIADLIHFTQTPSNSLFGLSNMLKTEKRLSNLTVERLISLTAENLRLHHLNSHLFLCEKNGFYHPKSSMSLLEQLQKPNTINKPICVQISGEGVRQAISVHGIDIQCAIDQICWVLAGKTPKNHVSIESDTSETAVKLQLWNDSITLKPTSLERYKQLINAPTLYQLSDLNGAIPPLAIAQKLITQNGGRLKITSCSPTKIELILPLE